VWSTTARDLFAPTTPHYPLGESRDAGIVVRRFAIDTPTHDEFPRYALRFPAINAIINHIKPDDQELRIIAALACSNDLLTHIATQSHERRLLFVPYPLPSSVWGVMLAPERSYLLPCMHDEPYAYHRISHWQMQNARGILANSASERDFIINQYHIPPERVTLTRLGLDCTAVGDGERFRKRFNIQGPMLFFAGRRDASKNVPMLLNYVQEYIIRRQKMVTLVLAGRDPLELSRYQRRFVCDVGFIDEQTKTDAFAAADLFVHAGTQESFAFVLMEAWLQATPTLVNHACTVTQQAVNESHGGLSFYDFASFAAGLDVLLNAPTLNQSMGQSGRAYVLANCQWSDVANRAASALLQND
jgi:glycosyltransferase involved in cell wall biosynthesis